MTSETKTTSEKTHQEMTPRQLDAAREKANKEWRRAILCEREGGYFKARLGAELIRIAGGDHVKARVLAETWLGVHRNTSNSLVGMGAAFAVVSSTEEWIELGWETIRDLQRAGRLDRSGEALELTRSKGRKVYLGDLRDAGILPRPKRRATSKPRSPANKAKAARDLEAELAAEKAKRVAAELRAKDAEKRAEAAESKLAAILAVVGKVA